MAWFASILSIHDTPVPSGDKVVNVLFVGGERDIRRTYHMSADNAASAQAVADFLQAEVVKLDTSDAVADELEAILGQQITAVSAPALYGVPKVISDRQFFHALAKTQVITEQEALAAVATGTIPKAMSDIVESMPSDSERFDAKMFLQGAVEFRRSHPLVAQFGAALGWTSYEIDDLFTFAGSL